jgi:hypothetical protein
MVNSMADVCVGYAVLASRRMDHHEDLVYYENEPWASSVTSCLQSRGGRAGASRYGGFGSAEMAL